jgi:hypothetical protein
VTTFKQAIEAYRTIATADGKSPNTVVWVIRSTTYFARFLGEDLPLEEYTTHRLREWIADLRTKPRFADHPTILTKDRPLSISSNRFGTEFARSVSHCQATSEAD